MSRFLFLIPAFLLSLTFASAQDQQPQDEEPQDERFTIDTPVILDLEDKKEEEAPKKKKKVKKRVFYGIKTRKGFTRKGMGERVTYELFYSQEITKASDIRPRCLLVRFHPKRNSRNVNIRSCQRSFTSRSLQKNSGQRSSSGRNFLQRHEARPMDDLQARQRS
jgi:hypothetical protein